jgi:RNA polymerase sigma-70 factor (ECF subfamily)
MEAATASASEAFLLQGRPDDAGAARAWTEELFTRHGRMVAGLCRLLVRDAAEAEDAAQQTFLSAHRALLNGSAPREPAPWLAAIARNECRARARARMREPLLLGEAEPSTTSSDALSEAIRRADLAALWRAIDALPVPQREALLLREFGGLSYEELAAALAVSRAAVESLLFRARRGLRERLSEAYAGFVGTGWVEALGRLFAGGSGAAAPVAAKAVAVGAAVVAGGAVVAPDMLQHRAHRARVAVHARPAVRKHVRAAVGDFVPAAQPPRESSVAAPARPAAQPIVFVARARKNRSTGDYGETGDGGGTAASVPPGNDGQVRRTRGGDTAAAGDGGGDRVAAGSTDDTASTPSNQGGDSSGDGSRDSAGSGDGDPSPAVPGDSGGDG